MIYFVYEMIILMSKHARTVTLEVRGDRGGMITQIGCFCEHYNDIIFYLSLNVVYSEIISL